MRIRLLVTLLGCAAAASALRGPLAHANATRRTLDLHFAPDARLLRAVCFGHRSTAADLLWLGTLGDLSNDCGDPARKRRWLDGTLKAVTELDPGFASVYSYGSAYLELLDRDSAAAIALLERGIAANPGHAQLAVQLAMAHYRGGDRDAAIAALRPVADDLDCDAFTKGFYASLLVRGHDDYAALMQFTQFLDFPDPAVREVAELYTERVKRLIALRARDEYTQRFGRPPLTREELRAPGLIAPEVVDSVVNSVWIDPGLKARFRRCEELELAHALKLANQWVKEFRAENGREPATDDLLVNHWVMLPPAPTGQQWAVRDGAAVLERLQ